MHTTPYRTPAKPVWPFLAPIPGEPKHEAEHRQPAEGGPDSAFDPRSDAMLDDAADGAAESGNVVAFRFRSD